MASLSPHTGILGIQRAKHLLGRATCAVTPALIQAVAAKTPQQALADLFNFLAPSPVEPVNTSGAFFLPTPSQPTLPYDGTLEGTYRRDVRAWWYQQALTRPTLQHKLTFFLHSIWVSDLNRTAVFGYDYIRLLMYFSDKSVKDLAVRMTLNNAMLGFLNNQQNTKSKPNENYAREVLELFTITKGPQIGAGNYTHYQESDIYAAARLLTGFKNTNLTVGNALNQLNYVNATTGIPEGYARISDHDTSNKTFSSAFGNRTITGATTAADMYRELADFFDMVFDQPRTAEVLAERLYRHFVSRNITAEVRQDIIVPIANALLSSNYDLKGAVTILLGSQHFYDLDDATEGDELIGALVKSPLELVADATVRLGFQLFSLGSEPNPAINFNNYSMATYMKLANQDPFYPSTVNGYPPYTETPDFDKLWISAASLRQRYTLFINDLLNGRTHGGVNRRIDISTYVRTNPWFTAPANATTLVNDMISLLHVYPAESNRLTYFQNALLGGLSTINWQVAWNNYAANPTSTSLEAEVRAGLKRLVIALVQSPEFQIK